MAIMADEYVEYLVRTKTAGGGSGNADDASTAAERMKQRLVRSRRYVVDDDVATAASHLATCNPEVLVGLLPGARSPHPGLWLEWNHNAQLFGTGLRNEFDSGRPADRLAALIEQAPSCPSRLTVTLVLRQFEPGYHTSNRHGFAFSVLPIGFIHDTDRPLPDEVRTDQREMADRFRITQTALASSLLGIAQIGSIARMRPRDPEFYDPHSEATGRFIHDFPIDAEGRAILSDEAKARFDITDEELEARRRVCLRLAEHASFTVSEHHRELWAGIAKLPHQQSGKWPDEIEKYLKAIHRVVSERSGLWGYIVALLAMMANPELVDGETAQRAGKNRFVNGKAVPFLEHRLLKLRLARQTTVERTVRAVVGRLPPRRHDVAGHWKTSRRRGDPECDHAWVPLTENRQSCALCEGLQWWVAGFERGDPSRGHVTKDRRVTIT